MNWREIGSTPKISIICGKLSWRHKIHWLAVGCSAVKGCYIRNKKRYFLNTKAKICVFLATYVQLIYELGFDLWACLPAPVSVTLSVGNDDLTDDKIRRKASNACGPHSEDDGGEESRGCSHTLKFVQESAPSCRIHTGEFNYSAWQIRGSDFLLLSRHFHMSEWDIINSCWLNSVKVKLEKNRANFVLTPVVADVKRFNHPESKTPV